MLVEATIPRHITGIYIFAVVNLLALLCISGGVDAEIRVEDLESNQTAITYEDLQANFGPDFPQDGLKGRVVYAEPPEACTKVSPPPYDGSPYPWILLIARGGHCEFADKVLNAQLQNYSAAIVHNYKDKEERARMAGGKNGTRVMIPSTFVGYTAGMNLKKDYDYTHKEYLVVILDRVDPLKLYLWPFAIVVGVSFFIFVVGLIVKFVRDHASRRVNRLSKKHLKKIPVRKFKKGDYYDTCAICLDEYEEGEKIRVLPCDHVYHTKCIDPWLTKSKKTCPVCKRRVIPGRDADSESGSDSEDGGSAAPSGTENTPLLSGSTRRPQPYHAGTSRGSLTIVGNDTSSTGPDNEAQSSSGIGTAVVTTLDEYGAIYDSDADVEHGAVGGLGISDRQNRHRLPSPTPAGNIQDGGEDSKEARPDKKRKRHERERKRRTEAGGDEERQQEGEDEGALARLVSETREERKERRKKKKEKKKRSRGEDNGESQASGRVDRSRGQSSRIPALEDDVLDSGSSTVKASEESETAKEEEKNEEGYVNPSYLESPEVVLPRGSRRQEMNDVV